MRVSGSCYCGANRFTVDFAPEDAVECNCTYCSRMGALWAYYTPEQFKAEPTGSDRIYAPNGYNQHHFCAICGCQTFGTAPDWQLDGKTDFSKVKVGVNIRLLEGFDIGAVRVTKMDGRNLW